MEGEKYALAKADDIPTYPSPLSWGTDISQYGLALYVKYAGDIRNQYQHRS